MKPISILYAYDNSPIDRSSDIRKGTILQFVLDIHTRGGTTYYKAIIVTEEGNILAQGLDTVKVIGLEKG